MNREREEYVELLERRLQLLRALARQLVECRGDFIAMDLDGIYGRIAVQESLCGQIGSIHLAIDRLERTCAEELNMEQLDAVTHPEDAACAERLRGVKRELDQVQMEVVQLNKIQAAYLRRSSRTVKMFMNFFTNYALTYTPPLGSTPPATQIAEGS